MKHLWIDFSLCVNATQVSTEHQLVDSWENRFKLLNHPQFLAFLALLSPSTHNTDWQWKSNLLSLSFFERNLIGTAVSLCGRLESNKFWNFSLSSLTPKNISLMFFNVLFNKNIINSCWRLWNIATSRSSSIVVRRLLTIFLGREEAAPLDMRAFLNVTHLQADGEMSWEFGDKKN